MKVNITGKGVIPGVNKIAPAFNQDLTRDQILRILNFKDFRVYGVNTGLITRGNIDAAFEASIEATKKEAATNTKPVVEEKRPTPKKLTAKKPPVKPVEEPVVEEVAPVVEEPILVGVDLAQNEDTVVEAPVVEESTTSWDGITDYKGLVPPEEVVEETPTVVEEPVIEETTVEVEEVLPEITEENVTEEKTYEPSRPRKKNKKNRN